MSHYSRLSKTELIRIIQKLDTRLLSTSKAAPQGSFSEREARSALHDREQRMQAILQTAVEGIITIDERGMIEQVNPAAEQIFGYRAAEIAGKNVNVLMPSPYHEEHDRYLQNYHRTGKAKIIGIGREVVGRRKDGTVFPMDLSVSEVKLPHRRLYTGFVRDISERKRLEKEILEISSQEQRRIGQDLHDGICQQLTAIELMSGVLAQNLRNKGVPEAEKAEKIAMHVRQTIVSAKSLARGLTPVELEANGLMSALQELMAIVEKLFEVECRFHAPKTVLVRNNEAATHLYRIAQEAINNAVKHGQATVIKVELRSGKHHCVLSIEDNGTGLRSAASSAKGMGFPIMIYRARMVGAKLEFLNAHPRGTRVVCTFNSDL